ncbi:MAG: stage II sporulation protein E [Clostridiales bacterium]|nr:stage II sporulation protein E [Clostridiales bacterium]
MKKRSHPIFGNMVIAEKGSSRLNENLLSEIKLFRRRKIDTRIINTVIILIFSFFIGRIFIFEDISPFGVAFFTAILSKQKTRFMAFLAILGGMATVSIGGFIFKYVGAMILIYLVYNLLANTRAWDNRFIPAIIATLTLAGASFLYKGLAPGGVLQYDAILAGLEGVIALVLVYIFDNVLSLIPDTKRRRILSNEEIISVGVFVALLIAGMWDIKIYTISIRNVLSVLFIIITAHIGGMGIGSAMGVLMGLTLSIAKSPDPNLIAVLGICGLVAGTFKEMGKIMTGLGFLLANAFMSFYISKSTMTILPFREILTSLGVLILIPKKILSTLKQYFDYSLLRFKEQNFYIGRMQELTVGKLKEFSSVFTELAAAFDQISYGRGGNYNDIAELLEVISEQVCRGCPLYSSCWERGFCGTYNDMFDLIAHIENKKNSKITGESNELIKRCIHSDKLIKAAEQVYRLYKSNIRWKGKLVESRQLVARQLHGVAGVVSQLAGELNISIDFKGELEDAISHELDKEGIRAKEVLVIEKAGGSLEVNISKIPCEGHRECIRKVEKIVSKIVGKKMTSGNSFCRSAGKGLCALKLTEALKFRVSTGVARKAAQSGDICGDSYTFTGLPDGKYMLALSDGMGMGDKAARESTAVISLLENFLGAGFDIDTTIGTINSILMLRSQDEIFATADLCIIDLVKGTADFVKIGAVTTYIKRKDEVEVIKASSLPIGILENMQSERASLKVHDGDMIVMVTDGVLDNTSEGLKVDKWMAGLIDDFDTCNPQEMADNIMESAVGAASHGDDFGDDMTIMVARIWKPVL